MNPTRTHRVTHPTRPGQTRPTSTRTTNTNANANANTNTNTHVRQHIQTYYIIWLNHNKAITLLGSTEHKYDSSLSRSRSSTPTSTPTATLSPSPTATPAPTVTPLCHALVCCLSALPCCCCCKGGRGGGVAGGLNGFWVCGFCFISGRCRP